MHGGTYKSKRRVGYVLPQKGKTFDLNVGKITTEVEGRDSRIGVGRNWGDVRTRAAGCQMRHKEGKIETFGTIYFEAETKEGNKEDGLEFSFIEQNMQGGEREQMGTGGKGGWIDRRGKREEGGRGKRGKDTRNGDGRG